MFLRGLPAVLVAASTVLTAADQLPAANPSSPADPEPGTGVIVGQVIDHGSGKGVAGAVVSLSGSVSPGIQAAAPGTPQAPPQSLTTADGHFLFRDVRKGTYTITAVKPGYLSGAYGARRPGGGSAPLDLEDGAHVTDVTVPLWRWGAISGTVSDETGEPVVGVEVRAFRRSLNAGRWQFMMSGSASTDDRGIYRISNLTPGDYVVGVHGGLTSVPLSVAETFRDSVQSGDTNRSVATSILLETGVSPPMPGTPTALQVGSSLQSLRGLTPPPSADESRIFVYPTTFHPATRVVREAAVIAIRSGDDRTGIDCDLKPVRASRMSGSVIGPEGPAPYIGLRLEPGSDDIVIEPEATTISDASGAFTFPVVPVGQYTLRASRIPRPAALGTPVTIIQSGGTTISSTGNPGAPAPPPPPTEPTLWAALPVPVGQTPVSGVTVTLQTGSRVRGRIEFDGSAERPDASQMQRLFISIEPVTTTAALPMRGTSPARVEANGDFASAGVPGGRYLIRAPLAPQGWHFKETRYEGNDLSNTPVTLEGRDLNGVTVVFTDRPTEVTGSVRRGQGSVDSDTTVLVFPVDTETWQFPNPRRMRSIRTSKTGIYKAVGLPPGDYYLAAVPDEAAVDWQEPRVLTALAQGASRVSLDDGDRKTQDLRTQQRR